MVTPEDCSESRLRLDIAHAVYQVNGNMARKRDCFLPLSADHVLMADVVVALHHGLDGFGGDDLARSVEVLVCHCIDILGGELFSGLLLFIREAGAALTEAFELADVVARDFRHVFEMILAEVAFVHL